MRPEDAVHVGDSWWCWHNFALLDDSRLVEPVSCRFGRVFDGRDPINPLHALSCCLTDSAAALNHRVVCVQTGHAILAAGGTAMDAVTAAVRVMEDSPLFNAGRGTYSSPPPAHHRNRHTTHVFCL